MFKQRRSMIDKCHAEVLGSRFHVNIVHFVESVFRDDRERPRLRAVPALLFILVPEHTVGFDAREIPEARRDVRPPGVKFIGLWKNNRGIEPVTP